MLPSGMLSRTSAPPRTSLKKPLYTRLAQEWYLPPMKSTGVTLEYLQRVDSNQVFRVGLVQLNRFLAECKPSQLRRVPFVNKDVAYAKVNQLLQELGQPVLGFEEDCCPDGEWLYRVARFADPGNLCRLFEESAGAVPVGEADTISLELGKRRIEEQLERELGMKDRLEVQQAIAELQLDYRRVKSREGELGRLVANGRKLERQLAEDRVRVDRSLDRAVQVTLERVRTRTEPAGWEQYSTKEREVRGR